MNGPILWVSGFVCLFVCVCMHVGMSQQLTLGQDSEVFLAFSQRVEAFLSSCCFFIAFSERDSSWCAITCYTVWVDVWALHAIWEMWVGLVVLPRMPNCSLSLSLHLLLRIEFWKRELGTGWVCQKQCLSCRPYYWFVNAWHLQQLAHPRPQLHVNAIFNPLVCETPHTVCRSLVWQLLQTVSLSHIIELQHPLPLSLSLPSSPGSILAEK